MINVVFSSSDYYYPYLYVTLYSLIVNNNEENICVYILSDDISSVNQAKLLNLQQENIEINIVDISNLINELNLSKSQKDNISNDPISIYSRLFLQNILPSDINKVLYFDCDSVFDGSIKELWNTNIENYLCAAVKDLMPQVFFEANGLSKNDVYINTGVLLINLKRWREEHIENEFLSYIEKHKDQYIHFDQGVVNGVCKSRIKVLPLKYNYIGSLHIKNPGNAVKWFVDKSTYYSDEEIHDAKENTVFYHFCGGALGRPWNNKNHYYYNLYKEYVTKSGVNKKSVYDFNNNIPFISKLYGFLQINTFTSKLLDIVPDSIARNITNFLIRNRVNK